MPREFNHLDLMPAAYRVNPSPQTFTIPDFGKTCQYCGRRFKWVVRCRVDGGHCCIACHLRHGPLVVAR